ncbi:peptidase inhibitor I78 family protein [Rhodobacter viridis]|uniref:Peptidase inhibitor I78 family protein n=1 Tax=Rhodobacter viridis TaxID=1054202 RepID=A0A318TY87_9RHOB|nr:I78 family peptidase inhibitor [Rhodobacter viridis]PYF09727.1 peptidase inhibitor I78 family protein [Rhodobacter viridis]
MRAAPLARLAAGLSVVSLTSGCFLVVPVPLGQTKVSPAAPVSSAPDRCGAAGLQGLVGQKENALKAMTLPKPTRVVHPGEAVTMDYSETRLNVMIDSKGLISKLHCG